MSQPNPLQQINDQIIADINQQILSFGSRREKNYKVFRNDQNGLMMAMRGMTDDEVPGYSRAHGPDTFALCLAYINGSLPTNLTKKDPGPAHEAEADP